MHTRSLVRLSRRGRALIAVAVLLQVLGAARTTFAGSARSACQERCNATAACKAAVQSAAQLCTRGCPAPSPVPSSLRRGGMPVRSSSCLADCVADKRTALAACAAGAELCRFNCEDCVAVTSASIVECGGDDDRKACVADAVEDFHDCLSLPFPTPTRTATPTPTQTRTPTPTPTPTAAAR